MFFISKQGERGHRAGWHEWEHKIKNCDNEKGKKYSKADLHYRYELY